MVESSDKTWSTGEGNGKPLQYSCLENPMNTMKRQKDMTQKDELPIFISSIFIMEILFGTRRQSKKSRNKRHTNYKVKRFLSSLWMTLLSMKKIPRKVYCKRRNKTKTTGQFSSVAQSCPTLCHPMNCSTPGLPVHHHLPESTQTHVHRVSDDIQPSHPLSSPSPPAHNPSKHQGVNSFPMSHLFT